MRMSAGRMLCGVLIAGGAAGADAATFKVGPSGDYASIQTALDEAVFNTAPSTLHEVRIQRGAYFENLRMPSPCCGGRSIKVSGGWNANFATRVGDPEQTLLVGRNIGRVLDVDLGSGVMWISNLTVQGGLVRAGGVHGLGAGAGIRAVVSGEARLRVVGLHVRSNRIFGASGGSANALGAGALITVHDSATVAVEFCRFEGNMILPGDATDLASSGGGLAVQVFGGVAQTYATDFVGNWAYGTRSSRGGGLDVSVQRGPGLGMKVAFSEFQGNVVNNTIGDGAAVAIRATGGDGSTSARMEAAYIVSQVVGRSQVDVSSHDGARVEVTDALVADGRGGVRLRATDAEAHLTNFTVVGNQLRGIQGTVAGGQLSVFNTIAYDNAGGDLALTGATALTGHNLIGTDPGFRPGTYRLDAGSPAVDAGLNEPPAELAGYGLDGRLRIDNGTVDIGAYEWHAPY